MFGNWLKTSILMAAILALFGILGAFVGGKTGMLLALLLGGGMNVFAYWFSDQMVLRMYNAQEVDAGSAPQFYCMVRELAQRAGMPMPKVYLIDEAQPNAFATGRNPEHAAVAATTGILQLLSARELRGVMAHELAHVRHRDILISTISATMAGAISALANFAVFFGGRDTDGRPSNPLAGVLVAVLAPLAAGLIQMAISRAREFEADRGGAEICGDPECAGRCLDEDRCLCARYFDGSRRGPSGNRADDDHESLVQWRYCRTVQHPPGDCGACGTAAGNGPILSAARQCFTWNIACP
jgi:heat shock protein HtpX